MKRPELPFDAADAILLLVDVQPRFLESMAGAPEPVLARLERLLMFAEMTDLPVLATLERPLDEKGRWPDRLPGTAHPDVRFIEKSNFDAMEEPLFRSALQATGRGHVVVAGAETDVCVLFTVLSLLRAGHRVRLLEDCLFTSERCPRAALLRMREAGATASTFKTFAYEVTGTVDRQAWPESWRNRSHLFPPPEDLPPR